VDATAGRGTRSLTRYQLPARSLDTLTDADVDDDDPDAPRSSSMVCFDNAPHDADATLW
jgi:hypothetical protein